MDDLQKFCLDYDAVVSAGKRGWRRALPVKMSIDWDVNGPYTVPEHTISTVVVELPEDRFRALVETRRWLDNYENHNRGYHHIGYAAKLVEDWEQECRLRHQHPSLQSAWEQYQVLLKMLS
jgi:hypothetical protein